MADHHNGVTVQIRTALMQVYEKSADKTPAQHMMLAGPSKSFK